VTPVREHCWNLFVLRNRPERTGLTRDELMAALKAENVGTGVHWQGLFGFSFYRDYFEKHPEGLPKDGLPHATRSTDNLMSLPLFPAMTRGRRSRRRGCDQARPRSAPLAVGKGKGVRKPGVWSAFYTLRSSGPGPWRAL